MNTLGIQVLGPDAWRRVRAVRVAALSSDPEAYGSTAEHEMAQTEGQWRERVSRDLWVVASIGDDDVGLLTVAASVPPLVAPVCPFDPFTTAWVYGCWVHPTHRGEGIPGRLIGFLADMASDRGWVSVGLGVFVSNGHARRVYERLGFEAPCGPLESIMRPGTMFQPMFRRLGDET